MFWKNLVYKCVMARDLECLLQKRIAADSTVVYGKIIVYACAQNFFKYFVTTERK